MNLLQQQIPVLLDPASLLLTNINNSTDQVSGSISENNLNSVKLRMLLNSNNVNNDNTINQTYKRNNSQILIETQNVEMSDLNNVAGSKRFKNSE